ncbi:MAG TPA: AAA family ATPase [Arenibacter sp.]|nr:AAA family ATPase [Arenibacter sp.]
MTIVIFNNVPIDYIWMGNDLKLNSKLYKDYKDTNKPKTEYMIVVVLGLPGSGKSYFANRLAESISASYINSDRLRMELFPKRTYSELETAKVYQVMLERMDEAIDQRKNLVLDATFYKNKSREPLMAKNRGEVFFIEIQADEDIIKDRLKKSRPYSEADLGVYQLIKQLWEPLEGPHLTLQSTNTNIGTMLEKALKYLKNDT